MAKKEMIINSTPLPQTFEQFVSTTADEHAAADVEDIDAINELWHNLVIIRSAISYKRKRQAQQQSDRYFHEGWNPNNY